MLISRTIFSITKFFKHLAIHMASQYSLDFLFTPTASQCSAAASWYVNKRLLFGCARACMLYYCMTLFQVMCVYSIQKFRQNLRNCDHHWGAFCAMWEWGLASLTSYKSGYIRARLSIKKKPIRPIK